MAIIVGIDEAGFGPVLGPLVVSGAAFRVPDDDIETCLWRALAKSCTHTAGRKQRRLPVADSKKLHKPGAGLGPLERTALVMLATADRRPATVLELIRLVAPDALPQFEPHPWYRLDTLRLPTELDPGDVPTQANAVRRDLKARNMTFLGAFVEPLAEARYNRMVGNTRNKSVVVLGLVLRIVDRVIREAPGEAIRICVDRLGGRKLYREPLTRAMPDYELEITEESDSRSAYRLHRRAQTVSIEFATENDDRQFTVALASIYSKYVRELCMALFNSYWCDRQDGLKPTAGYYQDAQRWLKDAGETISRAGIDRARLIRER